MSSDMQWYGPDASADIVVKSVQAIAVYTNTSGDIVIRQQDPLNDDDSVIVIPRSSVSALVKALKAEAAKKRSEQE